MSSCSSSSTRSWTVFNPDGDLHLELTPSVSHTLLICGVHLLGVTGALLSTAFDQYQTVAILLLVTLSLIDNLQKQVLRSHPAAVVEVRRKRGQWWLQRRHRGWCQADLVGQRYVGARFSVLRFRSSQGCHQVVLASDALTPTAYRHCFVTLREN